jgi:hypothetical protein
VVGQDLEFAVGGVLELVEVGILNFEPTGAHDVLPENKLLKESSVAAKDVRIGLAVSVGVDFWF